MSDRIEDLKGKTVAWLERYVNKMLEAEDVDPKQVKNMVEVLKVANNSTLIEMQQNALAAELTNDDLNTLLGKYKTRI